MSSHAFPVPISIEAFLKRVMRFYREQTSLLYVISSASAIFVFDTWSSLYFAVAVLHIVVVVMATIWFGRIGTIRTAAFCALLTCTSFIISHGWELDGSALARTLISLSAIAITTKLALFNIAARERLLAMGKEKQNLARFFSPAIVEQIASNDIPLSTARYEPAAVLFVDMIGFTKFCSLLQPVEVISMLRELLCLLSDSVFEHHGSIDKFTGDGLIAVFGPPVPRPLDASNAVSCAHTMQAKLRIWNDNRLATKQEMIEIAIGIHYGDVVLGDVGCEKRLELTVLGDTVNVASRVESYCRTLNASIIATNDTIRRIKQEGSERLASKFFDHGLHLIRGYSDPIRIFSIPRNQAAAIP